MRGFRCTPLVYFVQAKTLGFIKIGVTVDISDRLNNIQVGCPDEVTLIGAIYDRRAYKIETALHDRFADHVHRGEWFSPAPELLSYIARWPISRMDERREVEIRHALGWPRKSSPLTPKEA